MKGLALTLLIYSLTTQVSAGENHFVLLGGGGEPEGDTTIFDGAVDNIGRYLNSNNRDWQVTSSFNGGHSETESKLTEIGSNSTFNQQNFEAIISEYERKIRDGEITSGDQLLIYIDTHGGLNTDESLTHNISLAGGAITDYDSLEGSETVSLDRLENLTQLAQTHNINLGIVDLSCHSGSTLSLANSHTCVVSSAPEDFYGYADASFSGALKTGRTLEEVFLDAREHSYGHSFPMISTPAGRYVQDRIYPLLGRYITYDDKDSAKFSNGFFNNSNLIESDYEEAICFQRSEENEFEDLLSIIQTTQETYGVDYSELTLALGEYETFRSNLRENLVRLETASREVMTNFCPSNKDLSYMCKEFDGIFAMSFPQESVEGIIERYEEDPSDPVRLALFEQVQAMQNAKAQLLAIEPEAANLSASLSRRFLETRELALQVSQAAKRIYQEEYERFRSASPQDNPCTRIRF